MSYLSDSSSLISSSKLLSKVSLRSFSRAHEDQKSLNEIESSVFKKVVELKSQKIRMLAILSSCLDQRFQVQNNLIKEIEQKIRKEENLADSSECEQVILKNIQLRVEQQELKRQIQQRKTAFNVNLDTKLKRSQTKSVLEASRYSNAVRSKNLTRSNHSVSKVPRDRRSSNQNNLNSQDEQIINSIIQQIKSNNALSELIKQENNKKFNNSNVNYVSSQISQIRNRLKNIRSILHDKKQKEKNHSDSGSSKQFKQKINKDYSELSNTELIAYIAEEQQQKRQLYEELKEATNEMDNMRIQNEDLKNLLANQDLKRGSGSRLSMSH